MVAPPLPLSVLVPGGLLVMVPPRVLVVSGEQWPRALLRAELRHAGYDAIGASTLSRALRLPPNAERGPVRLVVVDNAALAREPAALEQARQRFAAARFMLIHPAGAVPQGVWDATLGRPVSIGDIVAAVRGLVPLPQGAGPDDGRP